MKKPDLSELLEKYGGLESKPSLPETYFNKSANEIISGFNMTGGDAWTKNIKPIMDEYKIRGRIAVDGGCGFGQNTVYLTEYFDEVHGFDYCDYRIQYAKKNFTNPGVNFKVHSLTDEIPVGDVDYFQTNTVLQHMNICDKCRALQNIYFCLAEGGVALFREGRLIMAGAKLEESSLSAKQNHMFDTPVELFYDVFDSVQKVANEIWLCKKVRK